MHTIHFDLEDVATESQNVEIWVAGKRRITVSVNDLNTSLEIPQAVDIGSINIGQHTFFLRTPDIES